MCLFLREREREILSNHLASSHPNLLKHERRPMFLEVYGKILLYNPKTRVFLGKYQIPKQNNQGSSLSFTNNISTYLKTRCSRINK